MENVGSGDPLLWPASSAKRSRVQQIEKSNLFFGWQKRSFK
jgi:hypothetical protein